MFLELTDDQRLFQETTARFIDSESPITKVRAWQGESMGYDKDWLRRGAELGWFAMLVPEALGGGSVSGNSLADAAIASIEMGRNVQPGPFIPMNVVVDTLANFGSASQHESWMWPIVAADLVATWAFADQDGNIDFGQGLSVIPTNDGLLLNGVRGLVQDAQSSDLLLVVGNVNGRTAHVLVPTSATGVNVTPLKTLDLSRRFAEVSFVDVVVGADALVGDDGIAMAQRQLRIAIALACAETIGVIDWLFTNTVEYSKVRTAFGRPIGSYQALKHIMADLGLYVEMAKAGATSLIESVQNDADDADDVTAMCASFVGDTAVTVSQEALQLHGGIGYTWEHDLHLFLRRARSNSLMYGSPTWHRERLVAQHGL